MIYKSLHTYWYTHTYIPLRISITLVFALVCHLVLCLLSTLIQAAVFSFQTLVHALVCIWLMWTHARMHTHTDTHTRAHTQTQIHTPLHWLWCLWAFSSFHGCLCVVFQWSVTLSYTSINTHEDKTFNNVLSTVLWISIYICKYIVIQLCVIMCSQYIQENITKHCTWEKLGGGNFWHTILVSVIGKKKFGK